MQFSLEDKTYTVVMPSVLELAEYDDRRVYFQEGVCFDNFMEIYYEIVDKHVVGEVPIEDKYDLGREIFELGQKGYTYG